MKRFDPTLYLVTDSTSLTLQTLCAIVEKACEGGATLVQLREKERSSREYLCLARAVRQVTDRFQVPLIIDDRLDIALAAGAAGIHVGAEDLPVAEIRRIAGDSLIIGATAKTVEAALQAQRSGADYLGTGAIFPTTTKVKTVLTDVSVLREICRTVSIPVCAIGGLNAENCGILKDSGCAGIAVVSAIMKSEDPKLAAQKLRQKAELLCTE